MSPTFIGLGDIKRIEIIILKLLHNMGQILFHYGAKNYQICNKCFRKNSVACLMMQKEFFPSIDYILYYIAMIY